MKRFSTGTSKRPLILASCALALLVAGCGAVVTYNQALMEMRGDIIDYGDILTARADTLRMGEAEPRWQRPLGQLEVDEVEELPGGNVLVGLVEIDPLFGGPSYGPYVAVSLQTGQERWRYDRSGDQGDLFEVILTDPVVLIQRFDSDGGSAAYFAVDPQTGGELWRTDVDADHAALPNPGDGRLFIAEVEGDVYEFRALDLRSGSIVWSRASGNEARPPTLELQQGHLLSVGASVRAMDAATGEPLWAADAVGRTSGPSRYTVIEEGLIVVGEGGRLIRLSLAGEPVWSVDVASRVSMLSGDESHVFALTEVEREGSSRLLALSLEDGSRRWERPLDGEVYSPLVTTGGRVTFTQRAGAESRRLVALDLSSGDVLTRTTVPLSVGIDLPDRVLPYDSHVVVAAEKGVAAYGWSEGEWLWSRSIQPDVSHAQAREGLREGLDRLAELAGEDAGEQNAAHVDALSESVVQRSLLDLALARQRSVYQLTSDAARFGGAAERAAANRSRLLAVEHSLVAGEMQFASERAAAGAEMVAETGAVALETRDAALRTWPRMAVVRGAIQDAVAVRQHEGAVRDHYYVRAHRSSLRGPLRWSVLVVDTETGRWTDISTSPGTGAYMNDSERFGTLAVQFPLLTSDGTLVVKGLGLEPGQWTSLTIGTSRVVEPSLLAYDFEAAQLHGADEQYSIAGSAIIDTAGRAVGEPGRFRQITGFSDGLASVSGRNDENWEIWGLIDRDGDVVVPPKYLELYRFREGLAPFILEEKLNNVGFMNRKGEVAIEPQFWRLDAYGSDEPYGFSDGLALVETGVNEYAYIDTTGQFVIPPGTVGEGGLFVEGLASVEEVGGGIFPRKGYVDPEGEVVIPFEFIEASSFSNGLAVVKLYGDEGSGAIDPSGEWVFGPTREWDAAGLPFSEERVPVIDNGTGKWGYLDRRGEWAVPAAFEQARGFVQGRAAVHQNGAWGFIDHSGAFVIPPTFDEVLDFSEGLAGVRQGEDWGYIRRDGSWAVTPRYKGATSFDSSRAVVRLDGKVWVTPAN